MDALSEINETMIKAMRCMFWLSAAFFVIGLLVGYMLFGQNDT